MSFALVDERTEAIVTKTFTRTPQISFITDASGNQTIQVMLHSVTEQNGNIVADNNIDTISLIPEELVGIPLINPVTGGHLLVDDAEVPLSLEQVLLVLYTIFKKAVDKREAQ